MRYYILRRLLLIIPICLVASFAIFAMVYVIPGDPVRALHGDRPVPEATLQLIRQQHNLDDPLPVQYGKWIYSAVQGDFGQTFHGREVSDILTSAFPVSVRLALLAFVIQLILGGIAGILAGIRKGSFVDQLVLVSTIALISVPWFVLGFLAQLIFGVRLGWLPVAGVQDGWVSYVLPASVVAATSLAQVARLLRTSIIENIQAEYMRAAIGKGLPRRRVYGVHLIRNSMIPVVTFLGVDLGNLMAGSIIVEVIFNLPGIGLALFESILRQEGPVIVAIITIVVFVYIILNLLVDVMYAVLDPRIRYT